MYLLEEFYTIIRLALFTQPYATSDARVQICPAVLWSQAVFVPNLKKKFPQGVPEIFL